MNDRQTNKYNMYQAVQATCQTHAATWNVLPIAVTLFADFETLLGELDAAAEAQDATTSTGLTRSKNDLKTSMTDQAVTVGRILTAYANVTGNAPLLDQVAHAPSTFRLAKDADARTKAETVLTAARDHLADAADYGLTQAQIDALEAVTNDFAAALGTPREAIAGRATATDTIDRLIDDLDDLLTDKLDPLFYQFHGTDFHTAYTTARQIIDLGG